MVVAGIVALPWFYLVLPLVVFWTTAVYFRRAERTLYSGLTLALFWFTVVAGLGFLEIIGPYYRNVVFYFSDVRNVVLYPMVLLIPVIYVLVSEGKGINSSGKKRRIREFYH